MIRWIFTFVLLPFFSFSLTRGMQSCFLPLFPASASHRTDAGIFSLVPSLCGGFFLLSPNSLPCTAARQSLPASPSLPLPCCPIPRSTSSPVCCYPSHASHWRLHCYFYNLFLFKLVALSFVPSSCPLFPNTTLQYCLFQQIDLQF